MEENDTDLLSNHKTKERKNLRDEEDGTAATAAKGFSAASTGLRESSRYKRPCMDMAMIYRQQRSRGRREPLTTNIVKAAPCKWDQEVAAGLACAAIGKCGNRQCVYRAEGVRASSGEIGEGWRPRRPLQHRKMARGFNGGLACSFP